MNNATAVTEQAGMAPGRPVLAFGPFRLHRASRMLSIGAEPVRLGGRAIDLLIVLAERAGEVISRAELERQVWPCSVVEESSLRVHIASLRRALGDGVGEARYIANVPGRGYSFVARIAAHYPEPLPIAAEKEAGAGRQLPARLSSLVGRERALCAISLDLKARRLATIVGHGGMGKTALALAAAHYLQDGYRDGACFVDLAPLTDPALVPNALATALGITVFGDGVLQALDLWLSPRHLLVVIDNCEHVLDAATALISAMLQAAPAIAILATSREPLCADGEWVHRLQPLGSPPEDPSLDCADALAYPALQLLVERAMASIDTFQLTQTNLPAAIALCRQLDGVPLAIEFAAARIGLLGVQGVLDQLDDRLRLLGTGRRTSLPRHRTLRALLDWSYALLADAEQRVFRRCGIFHGVFSLDSAVAILADVSMDAGEVRSCLLGLIHKSLIVSEVGTPQLQLRMLAITRAYAVSLLDEDAEYAVLAERHAKQVLAMMSQCEADWESMSRAAWTQRYLHSLRNSRGALDWAFGPHGNRDFGVQLSGAMMLQMARMLSEEELRALARRALDAIDAGAAVDPIYEMRLNIILADTTAHGAVATRARPVPPSYLRALASGELRGLPSVQVEALFHIGMHHFEAADYAQMGIESERIRSLATATGHEAALLLGERMGAQAAHFVGDHQRAGVFVQRVLSKPEIRFPLSLSSPIDRAVSMRIVQSRILWIQGLGEKAKNMAAECVDLAAKDITPISLAQALSLAAIPIALWRGDSDSASGAIDRLASHTQGQAMAYWSGWIHHFRCVLALRGSGPAAAPGLLLPLDALQIDHLVTLAPSLALPAALNRHADGRCGWSTSEVLRAAGERLLVDEASDNRIAEAYFMHSLAIAQRQGALAWSMRSASSLARLRYLQGRHGEVIQMLEPLIARFTEDLSSADLNAARELIELAS